MERIRFSKDYKVKDSQGAEYAVGQVEEMEDSSAFHFVKLGVAEIFSKEDEKAEKAAAAKSSKAKKT